MKIIFDNLKTLTGKNVEFETFLTSPDIKQLQRWKVVGKLAAQRFKRQFGTE